MSDFVQEIYDFNKQAGLLEKGYDDFLESSFQIEEALEGFRDLPYLATRLHSEQESHEENFNPREISRQIIRLASMDNKTPISDVDRLDKAIDAIVFAIGSIAKLGLNVEQIHRAIGVVTEANLQKLTNIKVDLNGKLLKDSNFIGPEIKLQVILDERL